MIAAAPFIPVYGTTPTLYHLAALAVGVLFGLFLERAGFGSAKMLTSVFTLRNWQVYKVMFTALVTAMIGAQVLSGFGMLELSLVEVGTTFFWSMLVGGLLFGVGFYFGGFCPGTAVVSAVRGRLDALVFLVGILIGIFGFAVFYDGAGQASWFQNFYQPTGAHVMFLYGTVPAWMLAIIIAIGVIASFKYLYVLEQRFGLMTPEQLATGDPRPAVLRPIIVPMTKVATAVAGVFLAVLAILRPGAPESVAVAAETPRATSIDERSTIDPLSLVGWTVSNARRVADEKPANSFVVDARPAEERADAPVDGAIEVELASGADASTDDVLESLASLGAADRNKPIVLLASTDAEPAGEIVAQLRDEGVNALLLEGGSDAWRDAVFGAGAEWPSATVEAEAEMLRYREEIAAWLLGQTDAPPAYLPIAGAQQLPAEVATAAATGSGGGGCG